MSQVLEPEPIEEQHGFFKQYVKIAGRKARCALCHGKILIDAPYSINNGLICHDACIEETTNLDNNVRRRTLKLMGIGAAFAGATAIGASRLASASGVQQTQITANGVILPSLTSDPANPEPGQMWYRSDAGVTAHFDAIENRVIYSNRIVNGSAVVTSKGIVNGLSVLPNDGQDWGPDTMLGATSPSQTGSPYTQTFGMQESGDYLIANGGGELSIDKGLYYINSPIVWNTYYGLKIHGVKGEFASGQPFAVFGTMIVAGPNFPTNNSPLITVINNTNPSYINTGMIEFYDMDLVGTYMTLGESVPYSTSSSSASGLQIGNSTSANGNSPPGRYIHDLYIRNCYNGLISYNGGGPSFYKNLHFDVSGYLGSSEATSGAVMMLNDLDAYLDDIEMYNVGGWYPVIFNAGAGGYGTIIKVGKMMIVTQSGTSPPNLIACNGNANDNDNYVSFDMLYVQSIDIADTSQFLSSVFYFGNTSKIKVQVSNLLYSSGEQGGAIIANSSPSAPVILQIGKANIHNLNNLSGANDMPAGSTLTISDLYADVEITPTYNDTASPLIIVEHYNYGSLPAPTTPSVPASGAAQQNTNPYAINVYLYGGTVTEIQITKNGTAYTVFSNASGVALSGQVYKLNPGDSIAVTYTAAPTWEWLSD